MYRRRVLGVNSQDGETAKVGGAAFIDATVKPQGPGPEEASALPMDGNIGLMLGSESPKSPKKEGHMVLQPGDTGLKTDRKKQRRMLHQLHRCMARTGADALALSASALQRHMDIIKKMDEESKFKGRKASGGNASELTAEGASLTARWRASIRSAGSAVRSYLLRIISCLVACVSGTAEAMGESPLRQSQRQAEEAGIGAEHEIPLPLFWAFHACLCCAIASMCFTAMAFTAQFVQEEEELQDAVPEEELASRGLRELSAPKAMRLGLRIIVVASVSFTSGVGLRLFHPVKSAILCAL
eukprot:TRINITY_DN40749_c0_g1_i1.p1 TRINITY_DN40749_c0_g1~~TRINITY_DN40749_c0_g1_i1.p1  ORF type:complete len:307 (-),score=65.04 TRINITY_DN40749_c0_g1_i1:45-941(-)